MKQTYNLTDKKLQRWKWIWGGFLVLAWGLIIYAFVRTHGNLTPEEFLQYQPANPLLAAFVILGLAVLKSVDFLVATGVLQAICGMIFPLPLALFLDLLCALLILTIAYCVGKVFGESAAATLEHKYPKLANLQQNGRENPVFFAFLVRMIGIPINIGSLYMSAISLGYLPFLAGSLLGWMPSILCYTIMGMEISDVSSPAFWWALAFQLLTSLTGILLYAKLNQRKQTADSSKTHRRDYPVYRVILFLTWLFYPKMKVEGAENIPEEAVIIVGNHAKLNGPIASELYSPVKRRTWCISEMMSLKEIPDYDYQDFWS